MCLPVYRYLSFFHGFQQRTLRLRRCAIDLVSEYELGENRAALKFELSAFLAKNRNTDDIGR